MPAFTCPHCQKPFNVPASASSAKGLCPHCKRGVTLPKTSASRWYYARAKKKYGPYTWQQLSVLAQRGDLRADDMLLQEGTKQWVRAGTLPALFGDAPPVAPVAPARPERPVAARVPFSWLMAGLASAGVCFLLGLGVVGYLFFLREPPIDPQRAELNRTNEVEKGPLPKKTPEVKKNGKADDKKTPTEKKPIAFPREVWAEQFLERLNRARRHAGLPHVTLDAEISQACLAHAKYLVANVDPAKADASQLADEDPQKPGFSEVGKRIAQGATIERAAPLDAFERWMGRVTDRAGLLAPDMQAIGIGFEPNAKEEWFCVLSPARGRRMQHLMFPAPDQADTPIAFSGGPEVSDPKAVAGFPITVTFPGAKQVTGGKIELRDANDKIVEGWQWTSPKKPDTIALIPKGLLQGNAAYRVSALAQVDDAPWRRAWSFTTEDDGDSKGIWAKKAIAKVNAFRRSAGLPPVTLDDTLTRGCVKHARYLVINEGHPALQGLSAHDEDLKLPGSSEEGKNAGLKSNIAMGDFEPIDAIDAWMATLYHRVPILEPNLKTIGFGCVRGGRQGWVTVMNVTSGRSDGARPGSVFYPPPEQTGVALSFPNGGEEPNPIPDDKTGRAGYPITAFFPREELIKNATGKLTDAAGIEIPVWFSSPDKPANAMYARHQGNTICLIPKSPLTANTTYHVHLNALRAGKAWEKQWKFTTGNGGLSVAAATSMVLERINHTRALVGLGAVRLDETLSRGCQLHAEYLAKNSAVLLKKDAPVNDEDVNLPGFTREGLRAAQQSVVFTNAPVPVFQIDDLLATASSRRFVLDPDLQRIGFGCAHDLGRGWRCVLDVNSGRGEARVIIYPAARQVDVPTIGFDLVKDVKRDVGFPTSIVFPPLTNLRNAQAVLTDAEGKDVAILVTVLEKPYRLVGVQPLTPLRKGHRYSVTVSVVINAMEWRQEWQFTTAR